jgi:hypothetical protein
MITLALLFALSFDSIPSGWIYRGKQLKLNDGRLSTQWTVKIPRTGGNCFATINVVPGGQEDLVKKIAATIAGI